ncbi:prolipoprotein diacylglyceryl transferase [Aquipuribacter hungaricus]|uniref:Phosphatidylglycerol--prolipoprotein diacylglyceryl transferase n=1 Tax=Aquipuribacter hungaricus TaxID=545624 RepID=A0ABV7WNS3_9MICO
MSLAAVPAGIPYVPFPTIDVGPLTVQVFGLCVAAGVLLGGWLTARRNATLGIATEDTERIVIWLVVSGIIGSRVLWVLTNLDQISSPLDVVAVWDGGLQFSGGFVTALVLAPWLVRHLSREQRWHMIDGAAIGLAVGMMGGRIGCYAVGEHLGGPTSFPLGITYLGGQTVEAQPDGPLVVGTTYWSMPVLEFLYVGVVLVLMLLADRHGRRGAGTLAGIFCVGYAVCRFASDFLRVNDPTAYGFTAAQYMTMALLPVGLFFLLSARRRESPAAYRARLAAQAPAHASDDAGTGPAAEHDADRGGDADADHDTDADHGSDRGRAADVRAATPVDRARED